MNNEIRFEEAFKEQLSRAKPLTEAVLAESGVKACEISGEPFVPGDVILTVAIPESVEGLHTYAHVAKVKKEAVESMHWAYYPDTLGGVPTATEESVLGIDKYAGL